MTTLTGATYQQLHKLHPEDVATQLGGIRVGSNAWRIPDLCDGNKATNSSFNLWVEQGDMHWWCHRCGDARSSSEALYDALRDNLLVGMTPVQAPVAVVLGNGERGEKAGENPLAGLKQVNVRGLLYHIRSQPAITCPLCEVIAIGNDDPALRIGTVHGWPILYCSNCHAPYAKLLNAVINQMFDKGQCVGLWATYEASTGGFVHSYRTEPGKILRGPGLSSEKKPKALLWPPQSQDGAYEDIILVVEGEKAAAAAASYGIQAMSWRGGKGTWQYANFGGLPEDTLYICWPDDHPDGRFAMLELAQHLESFGHTVNMVYNDGQTNDDCADETMQSISDILGGCGALADYQTWYDSGIDEEYFAEKDKAKAEKDQARQEAFANQDSGEAGEQEPQQPRRQLTEETEREWWCLDNALADVKRLFRYRLHDFAYMWMPALNSESPCLVAADSVGYWRLLSGSKRKDYSRLIAYIGEAREKAISEAATVYPPEIYSDVKRRLNSSVNFRQQNDLSINLATQFHRGNAENLPLFSALSTLNSRDMGLLTLQDQCLDMASGEELPRAQVMELGILFDPFWSPHRWQPGARVKDTPDARNVSRLLENLGDTIYVIVEMLMKMDRRIALLKSQGTGRGKSAIVNLMVRSLGSLVSTGSVQDLTDRGLAREYPAANNAHTKSRIVIYPEVDKGGMEKLNVGNLIYISGEPMLPTEYKYEDRIDRPRVGNPMLTMGEWLPEDVKGAPIVNWNVQGMFDRNINKGRLWAFDVDDAGGEYLPEYVYESTKTKEGAEAFIDHVMNIAITNDGPPEVYTEQVLEYVYLLMDATTNKGHDLPGSLPIDWREQREEVVKGHFHWTGQWDDIIMVRGLAETMNTVREQEGKSVVPGSDKDWAMAIKRVLDLANIAQLQIVDGRQNRRVHDGERNSWPIRGVMIV